MSEIEVDQLPDSDFAPAPVDVANLLYQDKSGFALRDDANPR
jgi:hypothetical protein